MDAEIIHINLKPSFRDHVSENVVHEHLECRQRITEAEEHYCGFKESKWSDKHGFPLISLTNSNVIVSNGCRTW